MCTLSSFSTLSPPSPANRRRSAAVLLLGFFLCCSSFAQQSEQQTPAPAATSAVATSTVIQTRVRQVLLDVAVTEGKNRPVNGLPQEDFTILEDGQPQKILSFVEHVPPLAETNPPPEPPVLPPNTFTNLSPFNPDRPLNVLLYDVLNTPLDDQPFAHKEIVKFLKNRPPGSWFAIFVLSERLHLLQGFTDDENQLLSAMNRKETAPHPSAFYQNPGEFRDPSRLLSGMGSFARNDAGTQRMIDGLQNSEAIVRSYMLGMRINRTVDAFAEIAAFLNGLPGRKNLIWLSGAFPAHFFPGSDPLDPFRGVADHRELRQVADLLTVGQIAVYPVDIRGLTVDPVFSAANDGNYALPSIFMSAHRNFMDELFAEQLVMDQIAEDTGGHAFYNTNGLAAAVATSIEDGTNYYTMSYSPSNTRFDGGLRKIRVKLAGKGLHLAYRHSYLADDETTLAQKRNASEGDLLRVALRRGAPRASELPMQVRIATLGPPRAVKNDEIAALSMFPAFKSEKNWPSVRIQRYSAEYTFPKLARPSEAGAEAENTKLEFVFTAYNADDVIVCGERLPIHQARKGSRGADKPYSVRHLFAIPANAAWLRLGARDVFGNRIGSVEIPLPLPPETPDKGKTK